MAGGLSCPEFVGAVCEAGGLRFPSAGYKTPEAIAEHGLYAPAAYPQIHYPTAGLRKAAATAGDQQAMALWPGRGHRMARELPAALPAAEVAAARASSAPGPAGTAS